MMGKCLPSLHQFYKELLAEERPSEDIPKLAALLSPSVCMGDPNIFGPTNESSNETFRFSGGTVSADSYSMLHDSNSTPNDSQNEISLIQISLIQMMCSKIHSEELNQDVRESYMKTLRILLEDMKLLSKLVLLFGYPDKLLSHLAVKGVASLILVEILVMDLSVESWISSYLYALSEDPGNSQAAEWVQTITFVIKEVLKRKSLNKAAIIEKFLTPMDSVFSGLYSFMFTSYSDDCQTIGATTGPDTENIATTNQLVFVDLLEIFVSIRIQLKLNFPCLRILYLRTSQLLQYVVSSAHYLVKKRLLMLLKQCFLCHAGESNVNDSSCATSEQDSHMQHDFLAVSNAVLQALVSGQFRKLAVSPKPCFFGGNEMVGVVDSNCGPDLVMIRAVCLILIKAMEIKVQTRTFDVTEQGCLRAELQPCVSQLMTFLRMHFRCPIRTQQLSHPCVLVSLVFGEQDDDMVEAARALLTIYINCYRSLDIYPQEKANNSCEACEHCFNPHCIFLLILQSLVFDHSVLLDFLISTETCFLEYLVRYLRLLQEDWWFFCCICAQFDEAADAESFCCSEINEICDDFSLIPHGEQDRTNNQIVTENSKEAVVTPTTPYFLTPVRDLRNNVDTVKSSNSGQLMSSNRPWPCEQPRSLVDYESSEDSDNEVMEASCLNILSLDTNHGIVTNNTLTIGETVKQDPEAISIKIVRNPREIKSHSCENNTKMPLERIFKKSVSCLTELRKTISRLQRRNLFPYNATALLKLLVDVETRSRRDELIPA
ncbi:protein Lines homolog 1 [Chiloscyllium plagiosum]|uniref:protein Lines homolog 1 n=1 Tax=Chiloscyllium plagiosum TaxID=36176 RepID=UPI001CB80F96|nr:protein Lines homolog 1 [Chiloscyllium plagiosum]XP_043533585.1 protein Lines homolog 1 [Chiloscyllium plagiosum]XP_043533586.1 protein Lines homolog 1 [Chiloscyllium plagiosum]